jgi:hypothetical protein
VLTKLRRWFLPQYIALVARLTPRVTETGGADLDALDEAEAARLIADAKAALARIEAGEGSLAELEAALLGGEPGGRSATIRAPIISVIIGEERHGRARPGHYAHGKQQ